ncbi:hypothetical protein FRC08_001738 [Ceratobasidium sp. 394]|nr:hypothetical protein FRC08_001738 [Ceratobasidium sp. 394]
MLQQLALEVEMYARAVALAHTVMGPLNTQSLSRFETPNKQLTMIRVAGLIPAMSFILPHTLTEMSVWQQFHKLG